MSRPPIHPGEILGDELKELGISANYLAKQLNVPQNRISQIIAGRRSITGDTALRLGHWSRPRPNSGPTCRRPTSCAWRSRRRAPRSTPCR